MNNPNNINNPIFSIVLPTYNRAGILGEAIDSVLKQDFDDWELLVIDDGSTDNTKEVVAAFTDPRVKYIYQENAERSAARNNGITQANGQYICFIDSDDWYTKDHLSAFYKTVQKHNSPVALFYCGYQLKGQDYFVNFEDGTIPDKTIFERILLDPIGMVRMCIHKDILKDLKLDVSLSISEDREFLTRVAKQGFPLIFSNQATYVIRPEDDRSPSVKDLEKNITSLEYIIDKLDNKQVSKSTRQLLFGRAFFKLAQAHYEHGNKADAKKYLKKAFAENPTYRLKEKLYLLKQLITA